MDSATSIVIPATTLVGVVAFLWLMQWLLLGRNPEIGNERKFPRQIILLALTITGLLAIVFALPIGESSRNQLIGLIGLLISGIIAFSSTNMVSNLMAGILLRMTQPFKTGDFIRVGEHFGRVSERGRFDTEIQTETRELIALPNTLLTTQALAAIRSSGTIISVNISLGYDVHHARVEKLLLEAAEKANLKDAFVHILSLDDFTVSYRLSGFLEEVKKLISSRSELYRHILDCLHGADIEIMSPSVMNQRRIAEDQKVIPKTVSHTLDASTNQANDKAEKLAEKIAFDKADEAEIAEKTMQTLKDKIVSLESKLEQSSDEERSKIKEKIEALRHSLKKLEDKPVKQDG
ncbi:mechanosensitive ion channel [Aliiglaciecola sp. CAU 1673]|uniref:mechanosensitive ion channel family protein n=1 Tax=Aliiglaciecola sp. CAU 1673 TaxID=3032595 RepID=UPI0023D9F143|nr:mechanosensitive ion channel domain-containing protein [Aliiglaciecola sp. CAU 1673]MDF2178794.1 mechanosensitive ion channel [Aliiglaciecola sp. CAU 1673]